MCGLIEGESILATGGIKDKRDKLLIDQLGECDLCHSPIRAPNLDHSHIRDGGDGYIRGVICRTCNVRLGAIENNWRCRIRPVDTPQWLHNAADYIDKYLNTPTGIVHPKERSKLNQRPQSYIDQRIKELEREYI